MVILMSGFSRILPSYLTPTAPLLGVIVPDSSSVGNLVWQYV